MKPQRRLIHASAAVVLAVTSLLVAPATPVGAVPTNRYVETTGVNSGDCSSALSPCLTIGYAITQSSDGDQIFIGAGTFMENLSTSLDLYFSGAGMDVTFINGGGAARVVTVGSSGTVTLAGMTIHNGNAGGLDGGGISNDGNLTLVQVRVSDNTADDGAGIYSSGPLTIYDSEISWNNSTGNYGGGIFVSGATTADLTRVSINYNSTPYGSGAVHVQGGVTGAVMNLTNVTMTGNSSTNSIFIVVAGSTANWVNGTIANNTHSHPFGTALTVYGGVTFKNTIVASNSPFNCFAGGGSTWTTLGNNLESSTDCGFVGPGDQQSTDPLFAVYGDYGGYIPTLPLLGASPAIDSGTNTGCPTTDARGFSRPVDGPGAGGLVCDKGAVEMRQQTTVISPYGVSPNPSAIGQDVTVEMTVVGSSTTPTGVGQMTASSLSCNVALDGSGFANCGMNFTTTGLRGVLFRYPGDGTHDASLAAVSHLVIPNASTVGVVDSSTATYFLRNANSAGPADLTFSFGWSGPVALVGDWDGNGTATIGLDSAGTFFLRNTNSPGPADTVFTYGWAGATPLVGDWDGDGDATIGIYDSASGTFFLRNSNSPGPADIVFTYGWPGATPVVGDWNADGLATIGIYDSAGSTFFLRNSNSAGPADMTFSYGWSGPTPIVGDWDGNGTTTVGLDSGGTFFLRNSNSAGPANVTFGYAWAGATPVFGDWNALP